LHRRKAEKRVEEAISSIENGPTIHPSCAILHGNDKTPDPITPVTMCATAVHRVPNIKIHKHNIIYYIYQFHFNIIIALFNYKYKKQQQLININMVLYYVTIETC
jgi:hypothetical protein